MTDFESRIADLTPARQRALERLLVQTLPVAERKRLVAHVVLGGEQSVNDAELRDWLRGRLPAYMVPEVIQSIDELPRRPNGKIDAARLPAVTEPAIEEKGFTVPRNETERTLARIWSDLLGLDVVSVEDNFFEVGGDSIVSIQVLSRARQAGIFLEPRHFADDPTIAALAAASSKIEELDSVISQRESADMPASPKQFLFRLDGLGNRIQYYELDTGGPEISIRMESSAISFHKNYDRETKLEEIATDYLNAIREMQPTGPYMFVSMACGAHVTYETAQQLIRMGEEVSFFAAVESDPPLIAPSVWRKYVRKAFRYLKRGNLRGLMQGVRLTLRLRSPVRKKGSAENSPRAFNHGLTINNYLPVEYPARITVFQSTTFHEQRHGDENIRLWSKLATDEIDIVVVPGAMPLDVLSEEHVHHLVERLPELNGKPSIGV